MSRVKRGTTSMKRRRKVLKAAKGFRWDRSKKERLAKQALLRAWTNAFTGRKQKKRNMRRLWQIKINAAARAEGTTYSKFMHALKTANIALDRKILADLAEHQPTVFKSIVETATKNTPKKEVATEA